MRQQTDDELRPIKMLESRTVETTESQIQPPELGLPDSQENSFLSDFWGLIVLGAIVVLYIVLFKKVCNPEELPTPFQESRKIPCKQCRFYSSNPHLRCAVQPSKVLKFEAAHCPDYCPKCNNLYQKPF